MSTVYPEINWLEYLQKSFTTNPCFHCGGWKAYISVTSQLGHIWTGHIVSLVSCQSYIDYKLLLFALCSPRLFAEELQTNIYWRSSVLILLDSCIWMKHLGDWLQLGDCDMGLVMPAMMQKLIITFEAWLNTKSHFMGKKHKAVFFFFQLTMVIVLGTKSMEWF